MRSKQTERSCKNDATLQSPVNTPELSKQDAAVWPVGRREPEGWHGWYKHFKINSIQSELVNVISLCPFQINLPCSSVPVSENGIKEALSGLP